jgi:DNA-binding winged helix-turn-helix (wHTH) protein/tetratricopeptide (TPR) repeat protein
MVTEPGTPSPIRFDPKSGALSGPAGERRLSPKAAAVLAVLIERPGSVVSKEELLAAVWPDVAVCDDVLTTVVYELRQALGESAREPRYLETLRKRGYRWIAPAPGAAAAAPPSLRPPRVRRSRWLAAALIVALVGGLLAGAHSSRPDSSGGPAVAGIEPSAVACDLFVRGVRAASEGTPEAVRRAVERLERAAALEPEWASPQLALAESHLELGTPPAIARARAALERAEALGADSGELHLLRAALRLRVDRDPESARRELRVARERSSCGGERIDLRAAETLSALGRHDEAIALLQRLAAEQPGAVEVQRALGRALGLAGRLREAEETLTRAVEMAPYHVPTLRRLAAIRGRMGDAEGSWQATRREAYALRVPPEALEALDRAWRGQGLEGVQRWRLAEAAELALDAVDRAATWAALGELERAAAELRSAGSDGAVGLVWVGVDPAFAPLREDARYRELVAELVRPGALSRS